MKDKKIEIDKVRKGRWTHNCRSDERGRKGHFRTLEKKSKTFVELASATQ